MILAYVLKLDLKIYPTNVREQEMIYFIFETFKIVLASFQVKDRLKQAWFF